METEESGTHRSAEELAGENAALRRKVQELERRLSLETEARTTQEQLLAQMREDLLAAVEEATESAPGATPRATSAEAIARLAEAKIAVEKGHQFPLAREVADHLAAADRMVAAAGRQVEAGNYTGAIYFSRSAQRTVEGAMRLARIEAERSGRLLTVALASANLRQGPSREANTVSRLGQGTRVISLGKQGEWVKVYVLESGAVGWMHASLLK